MGANYSEAQAKLIVSKVESDGRVLVLADGDDSGEHFGMSTAAQLARYWFVRTVQLKAGEQPTDCAAEELTAMLTL